MRVMFQNLIISCDWIVCKNNRIYLGTNSREIFYVLYDNHCDTHCAKMTLLNRGWLAVDNLHEARNEKIDCIADLVYNRIDW